jgi:hypothetical protein
MNIAFALLTTSDEYRRAVHSLQLDESLLSCLTELTGDDVFRSWKPSGYIPIVRTNRDVPRDLFAHAVIHEYAHARLVHHAEQAEACRHSCPALEKTLSRPVEARASDQLAFGSPAGQLVAVGQLQLAKHGADV